MVGQPWVHGSNLISVGCNRKNVSNLQPSEYRMLGASMITPAPRPLLDFLKQTPEDEKITPTNLRVPEMGLSIADLS